MAVLEISVPEYEAKAGKEESIFQDLHVVFKIVTRFSGTDRDSKTTWRRYREFELLRNYFVAMYPEIVMPPIPIKKMNFTWDAMGLDPFETAFLEERMAGLEVFLERVTVHPKLQSDWIFLIFVGEDKEFMGRVNETQWAEKADSRILSSIASFRIKKKDQQFDDTLQYGEGLMMVTRTVKSHTKALCDKQRSMSKRYSALAKVFSAWATDEKDIPDQLFAAGQQLASMVETMEGSLCGVELKFLQPLQEYCLYGDSLRCVARHQLLLQYDLEQTEEALSNKALMKEGVSQEREDQLSFGKLAARVLSGDTTKSARLNTLQREIDALEESSEQQLQTLQTFSGNANRELEVFQSQKSADMRAFWKAMVQEQIAIHIKAISSWQNVRDSFAAVSSSR